MKVLLLNGSPRAQGNTALALGRDRYGLPSKEEERQITNFIR